MLGNVWSKLTLLEKKVYLDRAEVEKKRYREELKVYRQSDAYQNYLNKKRLRRLQGNGTEESDMDATDDIDDEDNEELYCRSCDQWFHSLHNKKEHLYGRQHLQSLAGRLGKPSDMTLFNTAMSSTSLDESSLDGSSCLTTTLAKKADPLESMMADDAIVKFMIFNKEREDEQVSLRGKLEEAKAKHSCLTRELECMNKCLDKMKETSDEETQRRVLLEQLLVNLYNVITVVRLPASSDN